MLGALVFSARVHQHTLWALALLDLDLALLTLIIILMVTRTPHL